MHLGVAQIERVEDDGVFDGEAVAMDVGAALSQERFEKSGAQNAIGFICELYLEVSRFSGDDLPEDKFLGGRERRRIQKELGQRAACREQTKGKQCNGRKKDRKRSLVAAGFHFEFDFILFVLCALVFITMISCLRQPTALASRDAALSA